MMRLIKSLFTRLPKRVVPEEEAALVEQRMRLQESIDALVRQRRQKEAIYLLEEEVRSITSDRFRRRTS